MSWVQDEWKYNLPHVALQKIDALERSIEQLRKDQQQKKFKIDSLESSFENQKKKTEKEKSEVSILKKEIQTLEQQCRQSQTDYDKISHELQTKDNRISCLDGQLTKVKKSLENESTKVSKLSADLEQAISDSHKKVELLEQKEQDIQKLSQRLKLSSSDDVFTNSEPCQYVKQDAVSLISFDEPDGSTSTQQNLLQFGDEPPVVAPKKHSNTSQQSTTFNIFGDDFESENNPKTSSTSATTDTATEVNELKTKIATLQEKCQQYEQEAGNFKTFRKDAELKLQQIKSELDGKSNDCIKMENDMLKLTVKFEEEQVKNEGLDRSLKQIQKAYECERHNSQAALQAQEDKMKEQEKRMREEIALEEKTKKDEIQAVQNQMVEIEKKHSDLTRDYQTLERTHFQTNNEKQTLKSSVEEANQTISQLKSSHQSYVNEMKKELEDAHKKQIASYDMKIQEVQRELTTVQSAAANLKSDFATSEKTISELNSKCMQLEDCKEKAEKKISQMSKLSEENERQAAAKLKELKTSYTTKLKEKEELELTASKSLKETASKLEELTKELTMKKQANEDLQFKSASFEVQLNKTKKEKEEIEKDHNIFTRETGQREKELIQSCEQAKHESKVAKEREQLAKDSHDKLASELEKSKQKVVDSERTTNQLQEKLSNVENNIANMENQLKTSINEKNELLNRNKLMESEKTHWEERLAEKDAVAKKWAEEHTTVFAQNAELNSRVQQLTEANVAHVEQVKEMEATLKKLSQEKDQLTTSFEALMLENEASTAKYNEINTKLDESQHAYHEMCKKNKTIERDFQEQYMKSKDEVANATKEIDCLGEQNKRCEEAIESLQKSKAKSDSKLECLIEENEQLRVEYKHFQEAQEDGHAQLKDATTKYHIQCEQYEELQSLFEQKDKYTETLKEDVARVEQDRQIESNALKDTIRELTIKVEEAENEIKLVTDRKENLEMDNQSLTNDYQSMSNELSQLSVLYENVQGEKDKLTKEIETSNQKAEESANMLQSKETALEQLNGQLETLHDDLRLRTRSYEELLTEKNHVKNQLRMAQDELEDLNVIMQQQQAQSQSSVEQFNNKINQLNTDIEAKIQEIEKLENTIKSLQEQLQRLEELLQTKEQELNSSREAIESLKEQLNILGAELSDANQAKETLQRDLESITKDSKERAEELSETRNQLDTLKVQHQKFEEQAAIEQQANEQKLSTVNNEKTALEETVNGYKILVETLTNELVHLNNTNESLACDIEGKNKEIELKAGTISELSANLEEEKEKNRQLSSHINEKLQALGNIQKEMADVTAVLEENQQKIDSLSNDFEGAVKKLEKKETVIGELQNTLKEEKEKSESLHVDIENKSKEIVDAQNHFAELENTLKEEHDRMQSMVEDLESKSRDLETMETRIAEIQSVLATEKETVRVLTEDNQTQCNELKIKGKQVLELEQRFAEEYTEKNKLTSELEDINRQLLEKEQQVVDLKLTMETEKTRLEEELYRTQSDSQEKISLLHKTIEEMSVHKQATDEQVSALKNDVVDLQQERSALLEVEVKYAQSEADRVSLSGTVDALQENLLAKEMEIEKWKECEEDYQKQVSTLNTLNQEIISCKDEEISSSKEECKILIEKLELSEKVVMDTRVFMEEQSKAHEQEFEQAKSESDKQLEDLKSELRVVQESARDKEKRLNDLMTQCEETDEIILKLKTEKLSLHEHHAEEEKKMLKEFEQVKETLNKKQAQIKALMDSKGTMQSKIVTYASQIDTLQNKLRQNQSVNAELVAKNQQQLEALTEEIQNKTEEIATLTDICDQLKVNYENQSNSIASLEAKVEDLENTNGQLREENTEFLNLKELHAQTQQELARYRDSSEQLAAEMEQSKREFQSRVETLETELTDTKRQCLAELVDCKAQLKSLHTLREKHETDIQWKEACLTKFSENIKTLEDQQAALEAIVTEQKEVLAEKDDAITHYQETLQQQEEILNVVRSKVEESESKCSQLTQDAKEKSEVFSEKENELKNSIELLEQDLEQLEGKYKELFEERTGLQHKHSETTSKARHDIGTKAQEIQALTTKLQESENNCQSIQDELTRVLEELDTKISAFEHEKNDFSQKLEQETKINSLQHNSINQLEGKCKDLETMLDSKTKEFESTHKETIVQYEKQTECLENTRKQEKEDLVRQLNDRDQELSTLRETFSQLQDTHKQTSTELNSHVVMLSEIKSTLEEREYQINTLQQNISEFESQLDKKTESLEKSQGTVFELEQHICTLQEVNATVIKSSEKSAEKLASECQGLKVQTEGLTKDISSMVAERQLAEEQLIDQRKIVESENEALKQSIDKLTTQVKDLQTHGENYESELRKSSTEKSELEHMIEELNSEVEKQISSDEEKSHTIQELTSAVLDLEGKLTTLNENLQQQQERADEEKQSLRSNISESETLVKELEVKLAGSESILAEKTGEVEILEKRVEDLTAARETQNVENKKLKERIESMEKLNSDMTNNLNDFKPALEKLQADVIKLSKQKEVLNEMNKNLEELIKQKEAEVSQLTTDIEGLRATLDALELEKIAWSEKIRTLEDTIEHNSQSNTVTQLEKDELKNQVNELSTKLNDLETSLETSEQLLTDEKELSSSYSEELTRAKNGLENLQNDIATVEEKLKNTLEVNEAERKQWETRENELKDRLMVIEEETGTSVEQLKYVETVKEELTLELVQVKESLQSEIEKTQKLEETLKENEADFETLQEKLNAYKKTMKLFQASNNKSEQQLSDKSKKIDELSSAFAELKENTGKEIADLKQNIKDLHDQLEQSEKKSEEMKEEREHFKSECDKLRVCFDTLNEENNKNLSEKEHAQSESERLERTLKVEGNKLRELRNEINEEKENNICNKAEVSNLNAMLDDMKKNAEMERRKLKKTLHDLEKKDISITELEKELLVQKESFTAKQLELQETRKELEQVENSLSLEIEKRESKQQKLDDIKMRLLFKNNNNGVQDATTLLDESIDFDSHILQLQEQIALMESDKRKCIDDAVEGERLQIVESTKAFVMEREKAHEAETQDLRDSLELKEKKLENIQTKLKHLEDECKEKDYALSQEKKAYEELLKTCEDNRTSKTANSGRRRASSTFNGDELRELQERLEQAKQQNEELRYDFAKTVDDYEKARSKEKRDVDKLKSQCEKLKVQYEQKDIELKRYLSVGKDQLKNGQLVVDLRSKLLSSDEKFVDMQLKNKDLQKKVEVLQETHQKEMAALNRRLSSLLEDNEQLRKKIKEMQNSLNSSEKENLKMKQERAAFPFAKSSVSPLTRSLSTLHVVSSEDESKQGKDTDSGSERSMVMKPVETPKRVHENTEFVPSKSKRVRINSVIEEEEDKPTKATGGPSSVQSGRRRSSRIASKPYSREILTSSSEDETKTKTTSPSKSLKPLQNSKNKNGDPDKENPRNPFLHRNTSTTTQSIFPLSPKKTNTQFRPTLPQKKLPVSNLAVPNSGDQLTKPPGPTRVTRSPTAEVKVQAHDTTDLNKSNTLNARKPLRSQSSTEEEKCNMQ